MSNEIEPGRKRKESGKQQTPTSFLKLLRMRGDVKPYLGGLWALCETKAGDSVLINANPDIDDDAHVLARFTLAPSLVGFIGFRAGDGAIVADAFFKEWQKDGLQKLKQVKGPLESYAALRIEAESHQKSRTVFSAQDLIRLLITHGAELPWSVFALVLSDGRKVSPEDEDLSPGLLKVKPAAGFIGLLLLGGRLFRLRWQTESGSAARNRLKKAHTEAEENLRNMRPQPMDLMIHLTADTIALLRS